MAAPTVVSSATGSATANAPISITIPAGAIVGHLYFVVIAGNGSSPAGWLTLSASNPPVYYRTIQAGDPGSSVSFGTANASTGAAWVQGEVSGAASVAFDASSASSYGSSGGTIVLNAYGPVSSDTLFLGIWLGRSNNDSVSIGAVSGTGWSALNDSIGPAVGVGTSSATVSNGASVAQATRTVSYASGTSYFATASLISFGSNTAPNTPTGLAPSGTTVDRSIIQRLSWTFSDPDAGDSQSKFDLQWRHSGTSDAWNVVSQTTPNNYWDAPASTFPAEQIEWQVRTYDQAGAVGPYSALAYFTAADPATPPTITAPTSGGTISANPTTVTWSTAGQQAYQVRRVADNAGTADPTTVYWDSGQVVDTTTRSLSVPFATNNRWEHVQVRVQQGGLWSAWSDVRVNVSYTAPATASLVATPNNTAGSIGIAITNPAPSGGQPTVAYNDVYVRTVGDTGPGVRIAAQVANNGTATYWTPASGVAYEFLARTFGSNSTSTDSAWTA